MFGFPRETIVATLSVLIIVPCACNPEISQPAQNCQETVMFGKI